MKKIFGALKRSAGWRHYSISNQLKGLRWPFLMGFRPAISNEHGIPERKSHAAGGRVDASGDWSQSHLAPSLSGDPRSVDVSFNHLLPIQL